MQVLGARLGATRAPIGSARNSADIMLVLHELYSTLLEKAYIGDFIWEYCRGS